MTKRTRKRIVCTAVLAGPCQFMGMTIQKALTLLPPANVEPFGKGFLISAIQTKLVFEVRTYG